MYVAACLMAWPMTAWRLGRPTNLIWSIDGLGAPLWRVVLQMLLGVVVMDAWLYWKHRLLHTRLLFPLHNAPWPSESRVEKLSGSLNVNTSGSQLLPRSRSALHITGGGTTISSSDCSMPIDNQLSIPSLKQRKKLRERRDQQ